MHSINAQIPTAVGVINTVTMRSWMPVVGFSNIPNGAVNVVTSNDNQRWVFVVVLVRTAVVT